MFYIRANPESTPTQLYELTDFMKKALLSLLVLLSFAGSVQPDKQAPFFVDSKPAPAGAGGMTPTSHAGGAGSVTVDTSGASLMFAYVAYNTSAGTLSSSHGDTWVAADTAWGGGASGSSQMYICTPVFNQGSGDVVTTTAPGGSVCVVVFSGTIVPTIDQKHGQQLFGGTTGQPGSITTTQSPELLVSGLNWYNSTPSGLVTVDSGFTISDQVAPGAVFGAVLAYKWVPGIVTANPTFTTPQSGPSSCGIVSIQATP